MANIIKMSIDGVPYEMQDTGARTAIENALEDIATHKNIVDNSITEINMYSDDTRKRSETATALSEVSATISEKSLLEVLELKEEILRLLKQMRTDVDGVMEHTTQIQETVNIFTAKSEENYQKAEALRELCETKMTERMDDLQEQIDSTNEIVGNNGENITLLFNNVKSLDMETKELDKREKTSENILNSLTRNDGGELMKIKEQIQELKNGLQGTTRMASTISVKENPENNEMSYKLDVVMPNEEFTTPNMINNSFVLETFLEANATQIIVSDVRIVETARVLVFTEVFGVAPTDVKVENGTCTLTFEKRTAKLNIKVQFDL